MREFKFRAWIPSRGQMITGVDIDGGRARFGFTYFDDDIVMQYTGLKDKNGKEIYEGDVVKARGFEPEAHIVRFDRGAFCLEPITGIEVHFWSDIKYVEDEHGEVIGNIYQNPELLNK